MPRSPKPHQQRILDAFDAGERNVCELARLHGYTATGVRRLLIRYGRQTRGLDEARADPRWREKQRQMMRAAYAALRQQQSV